MDADTAIGGPDCRFPQTSTTALADAACADKAVRRIAHEAIVSGYWKPVYKYIRLKWRESNEGAKDLTQAFFAAAIAKDLFGAYDPRQAAFRTFLRLCVDRFVVNERAYARRRKRFGGVHQPLDDSLAADAMDPVEYFHREWVREVFSTSVDALRLEYARKGRETAFRAFELCDLAGGRRPAYAEIGAQLGVPVSQVTNYLAAARRDFRRTVLDRLRALTATEREFRAEAIAVLGAEP